MNKHKYTILTFIIGKNYEKVHEIQNKQDDVEYLLITDDDELKSNTWKVIYDDELNGSPFERCFQVRYNVFKYCSTDICITIDGSMQVKGSLDELVNMFESKPYDICLMPHPIWPDFVHEYNAWIKMRKYPRQNAQNFFDFLSKANYDLHYNGLFQLCFSIKRRTQLTSNIDNITMNLLQVLSRKLPEFERLDQTLFSYVMNAFFSDINVLPVSEQVVRSKAIQWYWHNSDQPNMNIFYDINKPDMKYMFNKLVECKYLI